jgi:hypothetical protein
MSEEKPSVLSNILAIIGLIILVIIIVWGLVHVATLSSGWFSSLFSSTPTITVTAPKDTIAGTPATVSWDYTTTVGGSYAFLYQCQPGMEFAIIDPVKNTASGIPCGVGFTITPTNNSIQVLPLIAGTTSISVPFSVLFVPTTGTRIEGGSTMTIHPGSIAAKPSQTGQKSPTVTTTAKVASTVKPSQTSPAQRTRTPADISVRIVAANVDQYGNGTITFNIANIGGSTSGAYDFTAQLPTQDNAPYNSVRQAPLTPGSHVENTLHFSQAVNGTFSVAVGANDRNQSNNYASQFINVPGHYSVNGY